MTSRLLVAVAVTAGLAAALPAAASAAARTITIDTAKPTASWTGTAGPGANVTWFTDSEAHKGTCGTTSPADYCDDTLVHFTSADPLDDSSLTFRIDGYAHSDYDLRVYTSDKDGTVGDYVGDPKGESSGLIPLATFAGDPESLSTFADPDSWYLVRIVYFTAAGDENYTGRLSWDGSFLTE